MAHSRAPAAIDALRVALEDRPGLAETPVYDGPFVTDDPSDAIYLGYDGDPEGGFEAVIGDQEWAGIGARARRETFRITCAVVVVDGDGDVAQAREAVYRLFGEIEDALRAEPSLGLPPPTTVAVVSPALFIEPLNGVQARLVFAVEVTTRV